MRRSEKAKGVCGGVVKARGGGVLINKRGRFQAQFLFLIGSPGVGDFAFRKKMQLSSVMQLSKPVYPVRRLLNACGLCHYFCCVFLFRVGTIPCRFFYRGFSLFFLRILKDLYNENTGTPIHEPGEINSRCSPFAIFLSFFLQGSMLNAVVR